MRKLLFITYEFPPINNSESIRSLKSVKYLQKFCWAPVVLTAKRPHGIKDKSLLSELPENIAIHRTYSFENKVYYFMLGIISRSLHHWGYLDDYMVSWIPFAIRKGKKILKNDNIDAIVSRSTPVASHLVAYKLKLYFGLHWIADFSDPWTQNPYDRYSSKLARRFDEYLERKVVYTADKIIFTTERTRSQFLDKYNDIPGDKVIVIPNFYDPLDFIKPKSISKSNKFTITYTGGLYGIRTPEPFFKALKLLQEEDRDINRSIRVKMIGRMGGFEHLISKYRLDNIIQTIAPISHKDVFYHLYTSDILLLIDAPVKPSIFLPTKLLEYIYIGKPILAITPEEGASADIIKATKTGVVVSPDDVVGIKEALMNLYDMYLNSDLKINPDWDEINKYSAERCTELLVKTLEAAIRK